PYLVTAPVNIGGRTEYRHFVAGIHQGSEEPGQYGQTGRIVSVAPFAKQFYDDIRISYGRGLYGRPVAGRFVTSDAVSQEEGGQDRLPPTLKDGPPYIVG